MNYFYSKLEMFRGRIIFFQLVSSKMVPIYAGNIIFFCRIHEASFGRVYVTTFKEPEEKNWLRGDCYQRYRLFERLKSKLFWIWDMEQDKQDKHRLLKLMEIAASIIS
jgi:hypothetical protein